jgi:hypothetical protein
LDYRCNCANQGKETDTVVEVTVQEQTLWSNHNPIMDKGVGEYGGDGRKGESVEEGKGGRKE